MGHLLQSGLEGQVTIKLSESMPVGCLVSPLDHEDILAQEKRLEELTAAHGQAIAALAAYRAEVKSLHIVIGNLQKQVALYACQPKLHDTDTLIIENTTLKNQAEVLYRDNVALSEVADQLRTALERIVSPECEYRSETARSIARAALEGK